MVYATNKQLKKFKKMEATVFKKAELKIITRQRHYQFDFNY